MTAFARTTQIVGRNVKCVTIGSVCKAAAAAAVIGMISIYSVDQLSRAQAVVAANPTAPSELRDLLCRIEGRCPTAHDVSRMRTAQIITR